MWFLYTVFTILCWSGSDIFSKLGAKHDDKYSHLKTVVSVGCVMGAHALWQIFVDKIEYDPHSIIVYLPVSALYIISMTVGYVGLRYLELSVSSPVCNSSGAVTALLCFCVLGQSMSIPQLCAVGLVCAGVFMLGVLEKRDSEAELRQKADANESKYTKGLWAFMLPIVYCILDALGTFADAFYLDGGILDETSANVSYELTFLFCAAVCAVYVFGIKREKPDFRYGGSRTLGAICETAGQFTYVFAIADNAIVAAPAISSYCVFSVLWSRLFLKEKLQPKYYIAIGLVLAGVVSLGIIEGA